MKIEISIEKYYQSSLDELNLSSEQSELLKKIQGDYPDLKVKTVDDLLSTDVNYFQNSIDESDEVKRFEKEDYVRQNFSRPFLELKNNLRLGFDNWLPQALNEVCSEIMANHLNDLKTGKLYLIFEPHNPNNEPIIDSQKIDDYDDEITESSDMGTDDNDNADEDFYEKTLLSMFDLSNDEFIKKIDRNPEIKKALGISENSTVQDLLDIDEFKVGSIKGIGNGTVQSFKKLQNDLHDKKIALKAIRVEPEPVLPAPEILSKLYLNYALLDNGEISLLSKSNRENSYKLGTRKVEELLCIKEDDLRNKRGFGNRYLNHFCSIIQKIKSEFNSLPKDIYEVSEFIEYTLNSRTLFVVNDDNTNQISLEDIDRIIIEDVDNYLLADDSKMDERDIDIAMSRWGYAKNQETLDSVGQRYNVARARIGQIMDGTNDEPEDCINPNLLGSLRIFPDTLWKIINENLTEELTDLLPNLFSCFDNEKYFHEFLDLCCGKKIGTIKKLLSEGEQSRDAINSLFCEYKSPISQNILSNKLIEEYGYTRESVINEIKQLQSQGKIEITEDGIYPRKLGKKEAIAHALTFEPNGLPWLDISKIINTKGFSKTHFNLERQSPQFHDNENVYLCERGTFRHIKYIDFDMGNEEKISFFMKMIKIYLENNDDAALSLEEFYNKNNPDINYYILRYLVRVYGEDFGIFFYGKAGVDNISLASFNTEIKRVSLVDRLVAILEESSTPMTKQQLALGLNKNTQHVGYLMSKLADNSEEIKFVRVDSMRFTTPEKAFAKIDVEGVMDAIKGILKESNIVEADVFCEKVNPKFNYAYDKNFYISLVKKYLSELNWYRGGYLFSRESLPYDNMTDACRKLCETELSNPENENLIKKHISLTKDVATNAVSQWRTLTNQRNVTI